MLASLMLFLALSQPPLGGPLFAQHADNILSNLTHEAQKNFQQGRFRAARENLEQALKLAPRDPDLWTYLGLTDEQLNNFDAAIGDFRKVLSILPGDKQARFSLGRLYGRKGGMVHALEMYEQGLKIDSGDLPANQNYALLLMQAGKNREAIVPLRRVLAQNNADLPTRAALIECYLRAGMQDEGKQEIQGFLEASSNAPGENLTLAKLLIEDKFPTFAEPILKQAVLQQPGSAEAHATLGILLLNEGQYDDATEELMRAVRLAPDSSDYSMHLTESLLLGKRYQEAYDFLKVVKSRFGNLFEYRFKVGLALYGTRQYPQAISQFEQLDRERPGLDLLQYYLGNSYDESGDLEKAQSFYRKAIELNPNQSSYYARLGNTLMKGGDDKTAEAIVDFTKALELDPSDTSSKQALALCHERTKDYPEAERLLQQVVAQKPELVSAHIALSRIYYADHKKVEGDTEKKAVMRLQQQ